MDYKAYLRQGTQASMMQILDGKERRVQRQQELLAQYGGTLISFTLNIAGAIKTAPVFECAFEEGVEAILEQLRWNDVEVLSQQIWKEPWGYEFFLATNGDIRQVKTLMVEIEDQTSIGRLFDIDVMSQECPKISRTDIGKDSRRCLVCGEMGAACARSRKHPLEELQEKTVTMCANYFAQKFADMVSVNACRALIYEVAATPKPGLVDRTNNGSHQDMDFFTFADSAAVLTPFFRDYVKQGIQLCDKIPEDVLPFLRYPGKRAEEAMKAITHGVNTHKGIIFSMGILCAAFGMLYGQGKPYKSETALELSKEICSHLLDDFKQMNPVPKSYGEQLYAKYGILGVRGEASQGFPAVRLIGLPKLKEYLNQGYTLEESGIRVLLHLIAKTQDTNILTRSNMETLRQTQKTIKALLEKGTVTKEMISELDQQFIRQNISPGGCADLLALTYFLFFMECSMNHKPYNKEVTAK